MQDVSRFQPDAWFSNLLAPPPSASNYMTSMAHAMGTGTTGASFITMSEGMQV